MQLWSALSLKILLGGVLSATLMLPDALVAAPNTGLTADSVYIVNMQRVLKESKAGQSARGKLEQEFKKTRDTLELEQAAFKKLLEDLQKQSSLLSKAALEQKQEVVRKKERELSDKLEDYRRSFDKKNGDYIMRLVKAVDLILKDLAQERGYRFVFERDQRFIIYYNPRLDLSEQVIKLLDERSVDL